MARADNLRAMQDQLTLRTGIYRRSLAPRISLVTGASSGALPLAG